MPHSGEDQHAERQAPAIRTPDKNRDQALDERPVSCRATFQGGTRFGRGDLNEPAPRCLPLLRVALARLVAGEPLPGEHDIVWWLGAEQLADVDWLPADRPFLPELGRVLGAGG